MTKESRRRCVKCGATPIIDGVKLFRFPSPGCKNVIRSESWARFMYPDKECYSLEFQTKLYSKHVMLCQRHFENKYFSDSHNSKLHRHAVPTIEVDPVSGGSSNEDGSDGVSTRDDGPPDPETVEVETTNEPMQSTVTPETANLPTNNAKVLEPDKIKVAQSTTLIAPVVTASPLVKAVKLLEPVLQYASNLKKVTIQICQICLRTDRKVSVIDRRLATLHFEMCGCTKNFGYQYCSECEHLLRKVYNFKVKCKKSEMVFNKWMRAKAGEKRPLDNLHSLLPPTSLGLWRSTNTKIYSFTHEETSQLLEIDPLSFTIPVWNENDNNRTECSINFEFIDSKAPDPNMEQELVNECEEEIKSEEEEELEKAKEELEIENQEEELEKENQEESQKEELASDTHRSDSEDESAKEDLKSECNSNDTERLWQDHAKTKALHVLKEIPQHENGISNEDRSSDNDITGDDTDSDVQVSDDDMEVEYLEDFDSDDNIENDSAASNKPISIDNFYTNEIEYETKEKIIPMKKSLIELANITFSDDEIIYDDTKNTETNDIDENTNIFSELNTNNILRNTNIDKNTNTDRNTNINNRGSESRTMGSKIIFQYGRQRYRTVPYDVVAKFASLTQNKPMKINLAIEKNLINAQKTTEFEKTPSSEKTPNAEEIENTVVEEIKTPDEVEKPVSKKVSNEKLKEKAERLHEKKTYSKEKLLTMLKDKFTYCGDLTASDGTVIDKRLILACIDNRVSESVMVQVWKAIRGRTLKANALRMFKFIQHNYEVDSQYTSIFDIEYLTSKQEILKEFHNRKNYECYIKSRFKCEKCYQNFKHKKLLEHHQKFQHEGAGFSCTVCGVKLQRKHESRRRMLCACHETVFKCRLCPLVTYYRCSMINHYNQHKGVEYKCEPCGLTYKSNSAYLTHRTRHRSNFICRACGRSFYSDLGLKLHKKMMHKDEGPISEDVKCDLCDIGFPTQKAHQTHIRQSHPELVQKPKSTKVRISVPRKKIVMVCKLCDAVGNSNGWLVAHFRSAHPGVDLNSVYPDRRRNLCHICGKEFKAELALRNHLNRHYDLRPHVCPHCGKRFTSVAMLGRHRLRHGPPLYMCAACGKAFRSKSNLYQHEMIHRKDRSFECSVCGKGFLHGIALRRHILAVHQQIRRVRKRTRTGKKNDPREMSTDTDSDTENEMEE